MSSSIILKSLQFLTCFLCWLTISPLFYYLAGRWKLMRRRCFLLLISPLFLYLYLIAAIYGYDAYINYQRKYYFTDEDRLERITGVRFPDMDVVVSRKGNTAFMGDYNDEVVVEFEDSLSDAFYLSLDSIIKTERTSWVKNGSTYIFNQTWGNGMPAPKGESEDEDRTFSISFAKGSKRATIYSGMW